jgi:cytochrome c-type biogenesis protein CcmH/NrfF
MLPRGPEDQPQRPKVLKRDNFREGIMKTWAGVLCLCLLVPLRADAQKDISRDYRTACERLVCQCGCNEQLTVCAMQNCSSATPMRAEIRERLLKGEGVEEIVDSFVARIGKQVLSAPTMKGFDITAWIMPFLILCLGLVVVCWIAARMARPAAKAAVAGAPSAVDPRVERELQDFEEES